MKARTARVVSGVVAIGLAAALGVPAIAGAFPRVGRSSEGSATVSNMSGGRASQRATARGRSAEAKAKLREQKLENLRKRIANRLRARKARFDAAAANISKRIERVDAIADKVEAAGGDVSAVRAKLDEARTNLANALALENQTIDEFNAIPAASNRKAAFVGAKVAGRAGVARLKAARTSLREAAHLLRDVVEALREQAGSADGTSTAN